VSPPSPVSSPPLGGEGRVRGKLREITPPADPTVVDFVCGVNSHHLVGGSYATFCVDSSAYPLIADSQKLGARVMGYDGTHDGWL
jgi:hypothetical protein